MPKHPQNAFSSIMALFNKKKQKNNIVTHSCQPWTQPQNAKLKRNVALQLELFLSEIKSCFIVLTVIMHRLLSKPY